MKKILAAFFALALTFALFSCGKNKQTTAAPMPTMPSQSETAASSSRSHTAATTSHPTATGGTRAPKRSENSTMTGSTPSSEVGTAPGGATAVR